MKRKPRSLFKARIRPTAATPAGPTLYAGPEFAGPEPHYLPCVDDLIRRHAGELQPGTVCQVNIYHDDGCAVFGGGACDCNPTVDLLKPEA